MIFDAYTRRKYYAMNNRNADLVETLVGLDGVALNLTGATVSLKLTNVETETAKFNSPGAVTTPLLGVVTYSWGATDLDTIGVYVREWIVTIAGETQTVPAYTRGWLTYVR